jgi:hypothetical protein
VFAVVLKSEQPDGLMAMNPILNSYVQNISFYMNFDNNSTKPQISAGDYKLLSQKKVEFVKGLFGTALGAGDIRIAVNKNINLAKPGTLIMWVSPAGWEKVEKEPYLIPFVGHCDTGYNLLMGRQGCKWGQSRIYAYAYFPDKKRTFIPVYGQGSAKVWKNGEWHMLALSWDAENLYISVDGKENKSKMLIAPLGQNMKWISLTAGTHKTRFIIDEFVVLNKKLSNKELIALYRKAMNAAKK